MAKKLSEEELTKARHRLSAGRITAIEKAPYFSTALLSLETREIEGFGTFAVDKRWIIYYDPIKCLEWSISEIATVWLHEIGHVIRNHPDRFKATGDPNHYGPEFNAAADAAINSDLREMGFSLPNPETRYYAESNTQYPQWRNGMTAEEMYAIAKAAHGKNDPIENNDDKSDDSDETGDSPDPNEEEKDDSSDSSEISDEESDETDANDDSEGETDGEPDDNEEDSEGESGEESSDEDSDSENETNDDNETENEEEPGESDDNSSSDSSMDEESDEDKDSDDSDSGNSDGDSPGEDEDEDEDEGDSNDPTGDPAGDPSGGSESDSNDLEGDDSTNPPIDDKNCGSGAHGIPQEYEDEDDVGLDPVAAEQLRKETAKEIEAYSERYGNVPGGLLRDARTILEPQVDWVEEFLSVMRKEIANIVGQTDYSYARPSRRHSQSQFIFPSMRNSPPPEIVIILDTSGSMSENHEIAQALGEMEEIIDNAAKNSTLRGIRIINCDAGANEAVIVSEISEFEIIGGGGTDMRVGIKAASELLPAAGIIITITDGGTPWPKNIPEDNEQALYIALILNSPVARKGYSAIPDWMHVINVNTDTR